LRSLAPFPPEESVLNRVPVLAVDEAVLADSSFLGKSKRLQQTTGGVVEIEGHRADCGVVIDPEDVVDNERDSLFAVAFAVDLRDEPVAEFGSSPVGIANVHRANRLRFVFIGLAGTGIVETDEKLVAVFALGRDVDLLLVLERVANRVANFGIGGRALDEWNVLLFDRPKCDLLTARDGAPGMNDTTATFVKCFRRETDFYPDTPSLSPDWTVRIPHQTAASKHAPVASAMASSPLIVRCGIGH
jgi:hypothetical protein